MKKNENKVANFIGNKVAEQIENIKETNPKSKTSKKTASKENKKLVPIESKKISTAKSRRKEVVKEVEKQQKPSIIEKVISNREVKYVYPKDIVDTLARKKWRQQTRNELHRLEREMYRIKDQNSKEYKQAAKNYETFRDKVLKPDQVA